jgi:hypothetical protein
MSTDPVPFVTLLYVPPSLRHFEPLRPSGDASRLLAYDLVEALRPRLVVDVGAGAAGAFGAFCQSLRDHDVDGLAYAVDRWEDDGEKPAEDETRLLAINQFLHTYFRGVAYLMQMPEEEALAHFAEGSIDLLRLDARRTRSSLAPLLAEWRPRVARGGVVLCAGVEDASRPDIAKDFAAFAAEHGGFVVPGSASLGVHRAGEGSRAEAVPELLRLLESRDPEEQGGLGRFYDHAARHHALRAEVLGKKADLFRKKAAP